MTGLTSWRQIVPRSVLENAKGFAIFTVFKAGFLFSARAGSGIVIAKLEDGSKFSVTISSHPYPRHICYCLICGGLHAKILFQGATPVSHRATRTSAGRSRLFLVPWCLDWLTLFVAWSAPSAIGSAGLGVGGQAGAEMTDFLVVLNSRSVRCNMWLPHCEHH